METASDVVLQMTLMSLTCPQDLIKGSSICTWSSCLSSPASRDLTEHQFARQFPQGLQRKTASSTALRRWAKEARSCWRSVECRTLTVDSVRLGPVNHVNRKLCHVNWKLCFDMLESVLFSWKGTAKETTIAGALLKGIKTYEANASQTPRLLIFKAPSLSSPFEKSVRLNRASQ